MDGNGMYDLNATLKIMGGMCGCLSEKSGHLFRYHIFSQISLLHVDIGGFW